MLDKKFSYDHATEIPSLKGKVIVITGANTGLGKQTALGLARHDPTQIWMTARNAEKGLAAVEEVNRQITVTVAHFLQLDLSSFQSIRDAAEKLLSSIPRLDIVFLNAGIFGHPPALTANGYEIHMGTNRLGHVLFLRLLTPLLLQSVAIPDALESSDVRVVMLFSIGYKHSKAQTIQFDTLMNAGGVSPAERYIQSKLANLLYAKEFARRVPQLKTVAVHPGETEIAPKHSFAVEEGVKNQLWAGTSLSGVKNGEYYEPVGVGGQGVGLANDEDLARRLWEWTEAQLLGQEI